jgi:hypothetical protein
MSNGNKAPTRLPRLPLNPLRKEITMSTTARCLAQAALALALCCAGSAHAQASGAFEFITAAEAQQTAAAERNAPPEVRMRNMPVPKTNVPGIRVLSPTSSSTPVAAPLRIELAFTPVPGTRIVPSSFRVLYGLLKIDLTDRLRKHATVTESGVVVDRAVVPDGQHRLILQVADDQGNTAEQELRIRVGAAS